MGTPNAGLAAGKAGGRLSGAAGTFRGGPGSNQIEWCGIAPADRFRRTVNRDAEGCAKEGRLYVQYR